MRKWFRALALLLSISTAILVCLFWIYGLELSDAEQYSFDEAKKLNGYELPLDSPKEVAAYVAAIGVLDEPIVQAAYTGSLWIPFISIRREGLVTFAADIQKIYSAGLLSKSEYFSAIGETVPTASYWKIDFRLGKKCVLAIKPSGRVLERWSKGCDFSGDKRIRIS